MVLGLLTNFRFYLGIGGGIFANQILGEDAIRNYVENPQTLVDEIKKQFEKQLK